jgi:hypothetical protein
VANNYVCAQFGSDKWNELHQAAGMKGLMIDFKLGPTDPIDPSKVVGSYVISTNSDIRGEIVYTYSASSYGYQVYKRGIANVSFCGNLGGAPQLAVTIAVTHCY